MSFYAVNINRTWEGSSGGAVVIIRLASHQCGLSLIRKKTHKELINIVKQYILNLTGIAITRDLDRTKNSSG